MAFKPAPPHRRCRAICIGKHKQRKGKRCKFPRWSGVLCKHHNRMHLHSFSVRIM